jgi:ADP-dependent phosphofructokinase/glucokinase
LARYNNNPDQVIQIKNSQIKRRLRNMSTSAEERLMKRLPREIRGTF